MTIPTGKVVQTVDAYVWRQVPSVLGRRASVGAGAALPVLEYFGPGVSVGGDATLAVNWRSGELGLLAGYDTTPGLSTPGASAGIGGGYVLAWGASSIEQMAGADFTVGGSAEVALGPGAEVAASISVSAEDGSTHLAVDPISGMRVVEADVTTQLGVGLGIGGGVYGSTPHGIVIDEGSSPTVQFISTPEIGDGRIALPANYSWLIGALRLPFAGSGLDVSRF